MEENEYIEPEYIEFGSPEDLDMWEDYGYESREEYEEYVKKKLEDPLYGYEDNLVTMKEMRALLQQDEYKPTGDDANYPDHLLLDEKTGMYYTDFFRDHRTHLILGHLLAVECMECENLDWERVTGGYSPYVISRFQNMCLEMLQWKDGKLIEGYSEVYDPDALYQDFDFQDDRAVWFADTLPRTPYLFHTLEELGYDPLFIQKMQEYGLVHKDLRGSINVTDIQWDILTTDFFDMTYEELDESDPYHTKYKLQPWNKEVCLQNFKIIRDKRGVEVVSKLVKRFQYDWRRIATFNEFGLDKLTREQKDDFRYFLFEGMEYFLDEWSGRKYEEEPKKAEKQKTTPEDIFSMRFQRAEEYSRFLEFMETERKEASNGDWARYALALFKSRIFVHSPKTFKSWLPRYGELFGRSVPYQDPNKLSRTTCQRDITAYLPEWAFK